MAKAITDEKALKLAKLHIQPDEKWTSAHHMMLIWDYFRGEGFMKDAKPEEVKQAGKNFDAFYNNSRMAYASNQAKGFADAGICQASKSETAGAEFA